jgi:phosphoserine aminotransferase
MDYIVTGSWSKKAYEEAKRLGGGKANLVVDSRPYSASAKAFDNIPPHDQFVFSKNPALIYYCENETVDGVQFSDDETSSGAFPYHMLPQGGLVPLVGDHSSSFMSRPIPRLADHAIIYAGAQKNIGPAGLTILIVRQDCIVDVDAAAKLGATPVPVTLSYKTLADSGSLYNTPSTLAVYISGLVLKRMGELGGMQYFAELNKKKATMLYEILAEGEEKGILRIKVKEGSRSQMNVVFDVLGEGREAKFLAGAEAKGMKALKGHR